MRGEDSKRTMSDRMHYGSKPVLVGDFPISLSEVMYYLYLPVKLLDSDVRLPPNVEVCRPLIAAALEYGVEDGRNVLGEYVYLSARKGWASPDNPLNRPGWHCDGFGTDDLNFVWWSGPGTRFAVQKFHGIDESHISSLAQFEKQVDERKVIKCKARGLYAIDPYCVHATPIIQAPGCMRQYIKVSLSRHQYNLENNSRNYLFDYSWPLHSRDVIRNDPHKAQLDYVS